MDKFFRIFVNDSKAQFLYPTNNFNSVALASYPGYFSNCSLNDLRMDDYLTRYMLECLTGIITGSDTLPDDPTIQDMKIRIYKGEGVIDSTTWIKKTNYPEVKGQEFEAHKCILLIRSPWDMMWQKFSQKVKETKTILEMATIKSNEALFSSLVATYAEKIHDFYSFWLDCPIPVFILRFEDLIFDPENCLKSLFQFLFEIENLKGTQIENRILTFLKYNKNYTSFLEEFLTGYEVGLIHYTTLQKNITLKYLREDLRRMGYLNEDKYESIKNKQAFDENELKALLEERKAGEREYQAHNAAVIKDLLDKKNQVKKYLVMPYMKINSKNVSVKDDPFET